jgi:ABC-type lipoprotein release transport system permease subunit
MPLLLRLALRNLRRNLRRSLITGLAIGGGIALVTFNNNLAFGSYKMMVEEGVSSLAGHVVVQAPGWQQERDRHLVVPQAQAVGATMQSLEPQAVVTRRSFVDGLLSSPAGSVAVMATAVDPVEEVKVSDWEDKLVEGEWLDGDGRGVLIGVGLASSLSVGLGDKVVLMSQGRTEVQSRLLRVRGLLRTGSRDVDGALTIIDLGAASALLEVDDAVNQIALHLPQAGRSDEAALAVREALQGQPVEVLPWQAAIPEIVDLIKLDRTSSNTMMSVIGFIVAIGVLNTVLMSVMERMRELGLMLAIGVPRRTISRMVILEGSLLGAISIVLGTGAGLLMSLPLIIWGLDASALMGNETTDMGGITFSNLIFAAPDWGRMLAFGIGGFLFCVLASAWPAWKAARLEPVEALRHV